MQYNERHRCLSYWDGYVDYYPLCNDHQKRAALFNTYTLEQSKNNIRTRELVKILQDGKSKGNGVVIFVQRVFLGELCLRVLSLLSLKC